MRTITKNMFNRLNLQKNEAKTLKLNAVEASLDHQLSKIATRNDDDFYVYAAADMEKDVQNAVWDAIIRVADYFGVPCDALNLQKIAEDVSTELIKDVRSSVGIVDGVGAYEPVVPGEERTVTTLEVSDE